MFPIVVVGWVVLGFGLVLGLLMALVLRNAQVAPWSGGLISMGVAFVLEPVSTFLLVLGVVLLVIGTFALSRRGGWPLFGEGTLILAVGSLLGWAGMQGFL